MGRMEDAPHIGGAMRPQSAPHPRESSGRAVELDRAVAALAGRQHGMVGRWQLLELGWSRDVIKRRIARGALHPLHRGVYAYGHRAITVESRWMAAVLA